MYFNPFVPPLTGRPEFNLELHKSSHSYTTFGAKGLTQSGKLLSVLKFHGALDNK
jgi:hypothetical protein